MLPVVAAEFVKSFVPEILAEFWPYLVPKGVFIVIVVT